MTDYCLFTLTHPAAERIYIRWIMDITEPLRIWKDYWVLWMQWIEKIFKIYLITIKKSEDNKI